MTGPFLLSISVFVFNFFITLFLFGSVWQIKLAVCQLLGAHKYSISYRIVSEDVKTDEMRSQEEMMIATWSSEIHWQETE